MRLPESIETHGYFWLAGKPDNRLTGVLRISERGEASLEMFGAFDSPSNGPPKGLPGQGLHILGVTDKAGPVTLVNCFVTEQTDVFDIELLSRSSQLSKSSLYVDCVFWRAHFDTEAICFSGMTFAVEGLDEWFALHHHPFSHDMDPTGRMSVTYTQPEPTVFQLPDNLSIAFHMGVGTSSRMFQEAITTKMSVRIESSRMRSFSEFMEVLRKVKNFICLALDRSVSFTSITGSRLELNPPHDSVVIYGQFDPYDLPKEDINIGNFLMSFNDIAHNVHEYLPRWLERYDEYEPTFNLYFAVAANPHMHLEGGFLFLVHGIESLHRRSSSEMRMPAEEFNSLRDSILQSTPDTRKNWVRDRLKYANELSLRSRIRKMVTPFSDLFGTESARETFISQVVNTRNYLTHYDQGIKEQAVTEDGELLRLHFKLEALVQLHLLRLLGIDYDQIRNMATRYPPLRRKLGIE
ncbi:MAG: hypothetical protein F4X65_04585 [Chloroflexi bacterium]|nr:hypothetical protein [Chloroflexota bacterium]